jgi:hypothetical protein
MTTNTTTELTILQKKEAFLWERLEEAVELTENTNQIATLNELLNGFGYELTKQYTGYLVWRKA